MELSISQNMFFLPLCNTCTHKNGLGCKAFPKGIPKDILSGLVIHDSIVWFQDNDIIYEADKNAV